MSRREAGWSAVWRFAVVLAPVLAVGTPAGAQEGEGSRPATRARQIGIVVGELEPGRSNDITDVPGVRVGHYTLHQGTRFHTGVTAVLPHAGNLYRDRVPAAIVVANGFGKLLGSTQVNELGELETPILLTGTLNVFRVADALVDYMLALPGMEEVRSINPVVGETNDGYLSDIRARPLGAAAVRAALESARGAPVPLGAVGAGSGTVCFGFKGGIGSASRRLDEVAGGWTVGVLVQTNFGGDLRVHSLPERIDGIPLGRYLDRRVAGSGAAPADGSLMIVVATDAPLSHRNLRRLAARSFYGMARTGGYGSNGSGDYAIAFSTERVGASRTGVDNDSMSVLYAAVVEAVEEAILDSLLAAETVVGHHGTVPALPVDEVRRLLDANSSGAER